MSGLKISAIWDDPEAGVAANEIEATLCKLLIAIGKSVVTEYRDSKRTTVRHLHTPAYYVAEWLAENWWAILYEPRKSEEGDDRDFLSRHSLLAAQHGFALPAIEIVPVGQAIQVSTNRHHARLAGADFETVAVLGISRNEIRPILSDFVTDCIKRLESRSVSGTPLEAAWLRIQGTQTDEIPFCELIGALGLSPYTVASATADAVDRLEQTLGLRAARDFCLATTEGKLLETVAAADCVAEWMDNAGRADLTALSTVRLHADNFGVPSWRRGLNAARSVMAEFNVSSTDPQGADKIFDKLNIDPSRDCRDSRINDVSDLPFSAAIRRDNESAKVALLQPEENRRRFAAARAIYLAIVSEGQSTRLATNAITRDQQASRQFAAEMLVPRRFLESKASHNQLYAHEAYEIARARRASPEVVRFQAQNAGIQIRSI